MNNWMLRKSPKPGLYVQRSLTWLKVEQAQIIDDFEKTKKVDGEVKKVWCRASKFYP